MGGSLADGRGVIEFYQVEKHLGGRAVLQGVSLRVAAGERLGVVGPNGSGKSTLLALMAGEMTPDAGRVRIADGVRIGWVRQIPTARTGDETLLEFVESGRSDLLALEGEIRTLDEQIQKAGREEAGPLLERLGALQTRFEHEGGYRLRSRAQQALSGLAFAQEEFSRPFLSFSGGWRMRAELARAVAAEPDLLLLDEPSNYLDIPAVEWLQGVLETFPGTLLLISHDRFLLNGLTTETLEVHDGRVTRYRGSFDWYRQERERRIEQAAAEARNLERERRRLERFIERFKATRSHSAQAASRQKQLARLGEATPVASDWLARVRFRLPPAPPSGEVVLRLEGVGHSYDGERWVLKGIHLQIRRGERWVVIGPNGAGKSTLLRLMSGRIHPSEGCVHWGSRVVTAYLSQDFEETFERGRTAYETVRRAAPERGEAEIRAVLGSLGFGGEAAEKRTEILSGGERVRLGLARLLARPANFLILDEPTTHLDLPAREALEEALALYDGTLVVVSHDIAFVRRIAARVLELTSAGIRAYPGAYDDYAEWRERKERGRLDAAEEPARSDTRREQRRRRAEIVQRYGRLKRPLEEEIVRTEEAIERLEREQEALIAVLNKGTAEERVKASRRLADLQRELEIGNRRWERAAVALEKARQAFLQELEWLEKEASDADL